jgi:hypothetical protein
MRLHRLARATFLYFMPLLQGHGLFLPVHILLMPSFSKREFRGGCKVKKRQDEFQPCVRAHDSRGSMGRSVFGRAPQIEDPNSLFSFSCVPVVKHVA